MLDADPDRPCAALHPVAGLTAVYRLTDNWLIASDLAFERLLADAADSPIVQMRSQFTLGLNLGYHF